MKHANGAVSAPCKPVRIETKRHSWQYNRTRPCFTGGSCMTKCVKDVQKCIKVGDIGAYNATAVAVGQHYCGSFKTRQKRSLWDLVAGWFRLVKTVVRRQRRSQENIKKPQVWDLVAGWFRLVKARENEDSFFCNTIAHGRLSPALVWSWSVQSGPTALPVVENMLKAWTQCHCSPPSFPYRLIQASL